MENIESINRYKIDVIDAIYPSPLKILEKLFEIDYKDRHEISST